MQSGDNIKVMFPLFQGEKGGAVPTSPLQYRVRKITKTEAVEYIKSNHYSRTCSPNPFPCYGLFDGYNLIGVLMFAVSVSENVRASIFGKGNEGQMTELHRLHIQDCTPKNTESWFIGKCIKFLKKEIPEIKAIISFADPAEGHQGTIYKATNFKFMGTTGKATFWRDKNGILRHPRQKTHINGKRVSYNITAEDAKNRGWTKEVRQGKLRYLIYL